MPILGTLNWQGTGKNQAGGVFRRINSTAARRRSGTAAGSGAVRAIGGGFAALKSVHARADRIRGELNAAQTQLDELGKAQNALARLNAVLNKNQAALETLLKRLPETEQIGEFLAEFDSLASQTSVSINKVEQGQSVREDLCSRTPVSLSCQGSFAALHALLYRLEDMNRIVRIERVTVSRAALADSCRMDLTCNVYGR